MKIRENVNMNICKDNESIVCYLCGPPTFVDYYENVLQDNFDVTDTRVERW